MDVDDAESPSAKIQQLNTVDMIKHRENMDKERAVLTQC